MCIRLLSWGPSLSLSGSCDGCKVTWNRLSILWCLQWAQITSAGAAGALSLGLSDLASGQPVCSIQEGHGPPPGPQPSDSHHMSFCQPEPALRKRQCYMLSYVGKGSSQAQPGHYDLFRFPDSEPVPYISLSSASTRLLPPLGCGIDWLASGDRVGLGFLGSRSRGRD